MNNVLYEHGFGLAGAFGPRQTVRTRLRRGGSRLRREGLRP
jgi:hypothetical protein